MDLFPPDIVPAGYTRCPYPLTTMNVGWQSLFLAPIVDVLLSRTQVPFGNEQDNPCVLCPKGDNETFLPGKLTHLGDSVLGIQHAMTWSKPPAHS